jgi:hypothetical protein
MRFICAELRRDDEGVRKTESGGDAAQNDIKPPNAKGSATGANCRRVTGGRDQPGP